MCKTKEVPKAVRVKLNVQIHTSVAKCGGLGPLWQPGDLYNPQWRECLQLKAPELLAPLTVLRAHTNTKHTTAHAMLNQNSREGSDVHLLHRDLAATCNPSLGSDRLQK